MSGSSTTPKIDSITSLRAIAAWWVVLFHFKAYLRLYIPDIVYEFIDNGNLAVDLFFCLSGFVIFLHYRTIHQGTRRDVLGFYAKRFARIYPLHFVMICVYVLFVGAILALHHNVPADRFSLPSLILNLFMVHNWISVFGLTWNIPSWSISAEFAAYLLFPLIAIIVRRAAPSFAISIFVILVALGALNLAFSGAQFNLEHSIETLGVVRCVTQFTIGAVLASIFLAHPSACLKLRPYLFVIAALLTVLGMRFASSLLIPIAWASLVLALAAGGSKTSLMTNRWLVYAGEISYATYMCHYFCYDVFKLLAVHTGVITPLWYLAIAFAAILLGSIVLYQFVEHPGRAWITGKAKSFGL